MSRRTHKPEAHRTTITLAGAQLEDIRCILSSKKAVPDCEDVPYTFTANFGGGIEADIKVCNGDPPYVDPVLFDDGEEAVVLAVSGDILGDFEFAFKGDKYIVTVEEGLREVQGICLGIIPH